MKYMVKGFRPLTGDLSSLLKSMKIEDVVDLTFPSPYRGLIFFTKTTHNTKATGHSFPSPYRGLIFFTRYNVHEEREIRFPSPYRGLIFFTYLLIVTSRIWNRFRPLAGDLSSLRSYANKQNFKFCFRPLAGDLSSLHKSDICPRPNARFPSPCRGLIFLTS